MRHMFFTTLVLALTAAGPALTQQVGEVGVDWLGNDIIVEAVKDPEVEGVTCHVSYFDRGVIDRLQKGNWFENPSDTAISCQQTGPIKIGDIDLGEGGEEIFKQGISLIWKEQVARRSSGRRASRNSLPPSGRRRKAPPWTGPKSCVSRMRSRASTRRRS